jgi:ubiquitin-protein ligase
MANKTTLQELDDERLQREYEELMLLSECSDLIKVKATDGGKGRLPHHFDITYTCRGYKNARMEVGNNFLVHISLPADYPRALPLCVYDASTPIFHPHIFPELGGINYYICIGHRLQVGLPLKEYVIGIGEMIQWKRDTDGRGAPVDLRPLVNEAEMERRSKKTPEPAPAGRGPDKVAAPPPLPGLEDDLLGSIVLGEDEGPRPAPAAPPAREEPEPVLRIEMGREEPAKAADDDFTITLLDESSDVLRIDL